MAEYFTLPGVEVVAEPSGRVEMHFAARERQLPGVPADRRALRALVEDAVLCELADMACEAVAKTPAAVAVGA